MKTSIFLTVVAGFAIQVAVKGQTSINSVTANYHTFFTNNIQKIKLPEEEKTKLIASNDPIEIMKEAEALEAQAQDLRNQAKLILQQATALDNKAVVTKIIASEVSGKLCNEKFALNKQQSDSIMNHTKPNEANIAQIKNLINKASKDIQLAKEMREEAYSWGNHAAQLGSLSNAEEKEYLALNNMEEAFSILNKLSRNNAPSTDNKIYVNIGSVAQQTTLHLHLKP